MQLMIQQLMKILDQLVDKISDNKKLFTEPEHQLFLIGMLKSIKDGVTEVAKVSLSLKK